MLSAFKKVAGVGLIGLGLWGFAGLAITFSAASSAGVALPAWAWAVGAGVPALETGGGLALVASD